MEFIEVKREEFDLIYTQMQDSFIRDEIRDYEEALAVLEERAYTLYHIVDSGARVGFISVWTLPQKLTFVEHFAVYSEYRNQGLGGRAIEATVQRFERVVLEAELPETEIAKRRIAFYQRHGFVCNDIPYMQPSYRKGGNEVPLVLLSSQKPLECPQAVVADIYQTVYQK